MARQMSSCELGCKGCREAFDTHGYPSHVCLTSTTVKACVVNRWQCHCRAAKNWLHSLRVVNQVDAHRSANCIHDRFSGVLLWQVAEAWQGQSLDAVMHKRKSKLQLDKENAAAAANKTPPAPKQLSAAPRSAPSQPSGKQCTTMHTLRRSSSALPKLLFSCSVLVQCSEYKSSCSSCMPMVLLS